MANESVRITYLLNSGFVVEGGTDRWALVFDAYRDVRGDVERVLASARSVYFFVSHAHFDHFSPAIARYGKASGFFLSEDIRALAEAGRFPADKTVWLGKYDGWEGEGLRVESFDSTDEGTSFLVELDGWRIFHAGDFNWWHWKNDPPDAIGFARNGFFKQMKRLDGRAFDLAFFPADGRLEEARDWGAKEFCRRTGTGALVTMHSVGYPRFAPGGDFFGPGREIPVWSPAEPGERRTYKKGSGFSE
ncbi:MAG: MBL fold metallo-hydrolase [Schwartzia sp.]|nr:MBL fold metallo-hydrolase [Schwartzia sp. (in: firmicutes)]